MLLAEDLAPLTVIRTETVLSRLPIHNLAKKGKVDIQITRRNTKGEVDLRWEVSHSDRYGQARQLAYKIDTLVVNRRIDEESRPIPKMIRLGTLSQICRELGVPSSGKNTNDLRRALHQNAGAYITAKLSYRGTDGSERRLEAGFTRYGVAFTGDQLPDGRSADAVYIILNDPYREVLNSAPVRPLNYDYLRELRPAAQRFYEIIGYRIFAALKHKRPFAKLTYSDYCTFSAQQRYDDYEHCRVQMYKVHKPHLDSGYLASVKCQETAAAGGRPDWTFWYVPGAKAEAEYKAFTARRSNAPPRADDVLTIETENELEGTDAGDASLLDELTRRGVNPRKARELLATLPDGQPVREQIEWADSLIRQGTSSAIRNPPGFYVSILRDNITPPEGFQTSAQKKADAMEQTLRQMELHRLEAAYEAYRNSAIDGVINARLQSGSYEAAVSARRNSLKTEYPFLTPHALQDLAERSYRTELGKDLPLLSFEEFSARGK